MKKLAALAGILIAIASCKNETKTGSPMHAPKLDSVLSSYWEERLQLFPVEATGYGDKRYNDRLTITIAQSFRDSLARFYNKYLEAARTIDTTGMSDDDKVSVQLLTYEMAMGLEGLKFPTHLMPINQFWAFTLDLPQLGSGTGNQPFKTVEDYDNWLKRISVFPAWADTAIRNMRLGIDIGWVLPKTLVKKVLPQLRDVVVANDTTSIFYGPIRTMPADFSAADKQRLADAYAAMVRDVINPTYVKLHHFFEHDYLPKARSGSGIFNLPDGLDYYNYCVRYWTTTTMPPDSIYQTGIREVARIEAEMNKVREKVGFTGSLKEFFKYLGEDRRFFPFTTPQQVLDSFSNIKKHEDALLPKLFNKTPQTEFTIRQTEAFRAASASAEYNPGSEDGTRPGIFYVPIVDATKYNCVAMATLFLHEAIPGHHYQISLQQENKDLPAFRRFLWYGAYGEGWAHYSETLGTELGLYDDPYQYFGHLSDGIHRAIRLVVDVGMHYKNMSREDAIKYMMAHELVSEAEATSEIERYMAIPGQALSYKIGQLAILNERAKYKQQMGSKFNIASFHDEVLKDGCVPLEVLKTKLQKWSKK